MKRHIMSLLLAVLFTGGLALDSGLAEERLGRGQSGPSGKYAKWVNEDVLYIIHPREKDVFLSLKTDRERDLFIECFWKQRDPTPLTEQNEFREEHYWRIAEANRTYGTASVPGWKTPAGRTDIILGDAQSTFVTEMRLRVFEGIRAVGASETDVVTSSYLKHTLSANLESEDSLEDEERQIRKVFNLADVKLLTEADLAWERGKSENAFHVFRLDGREYLVQVKPGMAASQQFQIDIFEQSYEPRKQTNLLGLKYNIPPDKAAVFGFEDSRGTPYFLLLRVTRVGGVLGGVVGGVVGGVKGEVERGRVVAPKLVKKVDPVYPAEARKAGVQGVVILEAMTDIDGRVKSVEILRSVPELDDAALTAMKQWVYEPMIIDGKPQPVTFTVTMRFKLDEGGGGVKGVEGGVAGGGVEGGVRGEVVGGVRGGVVGGVIGGVGDQAKAPKLIKKVDPVYPEEARQARVEGVVVLEATTDVYGRVTKVEVLESVPMLDQAAVDALKQWLYEPMLIDGKPQPVTFHVTMRFKLNGKDEAVGGVVGGVIGGVEGGVKGKVVGGVEGGIVGGVVGGVMDLEEFAKGAVRAVGNIKPPKLIKRVDPVYPAAAREEQVSGVVILGVKTDELGQVVDAQVLRSVPLLDQAAIDAVKQWVYEPMIIEGKPQPVVFTVTVRFQLK